MNTWRAIPASQIMFAPDWKLIGEPGKLEFLSPT